MIRPRLFLCSGQIIPDQDPLRVGRVVVDLSTNYPNANVHVRLFDLAKTFLKNLSPRLEDILEIAAFPSPMRLSGHAPLELHIRMRCPSSADCLN
jgi:hypothetical protein